MSMRGGLAVYVTSHGFGHLNRVVAVLNRLPSDVPLTVRSNPNLFDHWRERLTRPAALEAHVSDSGAVNPPGDSNATDGPASLALAEIVYAEAVERIDEEADRLRDAGTAAVLCDVPPLPLVAASRAGVPGYLLGNFTWAEIYAPHAKRQGGGAVQLVRNLRAAYRQATGLFRAEPALAMTEAGPVLESGIIVSPGRNRRTELRKLLGLGASERLVYIYVGRYGQANLGWPRLARMERVHFVGFHPAPARAGAVPNLHVVPPTDWTGADLAASADAIVAKAGYGTVSEAMAAGTPFIYPPRAGFAEHRALDRALRAWGGGVPASTRAFGEMRIERLLERAFALRPGPPPFRIDTAGRVARYLTQQCRQASPGRVRRKARTA